jgi:hypothetical protein
VAAREELRAIRRQLTLRHVIWGTFRHRDERVIRGPHWGLRTRQSFHDGLCAAELLVAIRRILNGKEPLSASEKLVHMRLASRRAADIARDNVSISRRLANKKAQVPPDPQDTSGQPDRKWLPAEKRDRTRWLFWQRRTPSWEAAYNTACAYAALDRDDRVVISLQRALSNRNCELQQPWNWISQDPDFSRLKSSSEKFNGFLCSLERSDYPKAAGQPVDADEMGNGASCDVSSSSLEAVLAGSTLE